MSELIHPALGMLPDEFEAQGQKIVELMNVELPNLSSRVLTFTGAIAGEGVSTVACSVACLLARNPRSRVLLVDANLRAPVSPWLFLNPPKHGLVSLLLGECELADAVRTMDPPNLQVLASGRSEAALLGELAASQVEKGISALRERFNHVLIDAAPVSASPFSLLLTRQSDGVLLVISTGGAPRDLAATTVARLQQDSRLLGAVLTRRAWAGPGKARRAGIREPW